MIIIKKTYFNIILLIVILVTLKSISILNFNKIYPTEQEKKLITNLIPKIKINSQDDIIFIQNFVVNNLENGPNSSYKKAINITCLLNERVGSCFDRSLLLQKILILNNIKIRPVYIFFSPYRKQTLILDFFKGSTQSHNVFEYYYNSDWYILETNKVQKKELKLGEYINIYYPYNNVRYIRHLNNRNSYMLDPWFLPDIY